MAKCENLEMKITARVVEETICSSCIHRDVCVYKQTYLEYLDACEKMRGDYPDDISFIKKNDPDCNFHKKKSDVNLR